MESFHFKYGQCEQCGLSTEAVGPLKVVNFWQETHSGFVPTYLYVCDSCFASRHLWCDHLFPDYCEACNSKIEDGDHYQQREPGKDPQGSSATEKEKCRIVCYACHKSNA